MASTEVLIIASVFCCVFGATLLAVAIIFTRSYLKLRRERQDRLADKVETTVLGTKHLAYPAAFCKAADFVTLGRLEPYETLRDQNMLVYQDTYYGLVQDPRYIVFISHRKLSGCICGVTPCTECAFRVTSHRMDWLVWA